jgi:hypothetical protein
VSNAADDDLAVTALATLPIIPQPDTRYYDRFAAAAANGWSRESFFPIGTWFSAVRSPGDLDNDRALGLNTYFHLTDNSDMQLLEGSGFSVLLAQPFTRRPPQLVGNLLGDEVDMKAGPGSGPAVPGAEDQAEPCAIPAEDCGYSVMANGRFNAASTGPAVMNWANYGKGVAFWETDQEAAAFVNGFTDIVSTDVYWYTDPNVCDEAQNFRGVPPDRCRRAANYGALIDRQRVLDSTDAVTQPIFAVVETGTPGANWSTIAPEQVAGAVISSVIHGARGVIYFDHNFGGPCRSDTGLRDCDPSTRAAVQAVNQQLRDLAPALNGPGRAFTVGSGLDTTLRVAGDAAYLVAMIDRDTEPGVRTLRLPDSLRGWTVSAPYEGRQLSRTGQDTFTDNFAQESSYHIYRITP